MCGLDSVGRRCAAGAAAGATAAVACDRNADVGGPSSATFALMVDRAALGSALDEVVAGAGVVECPAGSSRLGRGGANATPQKVTGTLVCGVVSEKPMLAWTHTDRLLLSTVHGSPGGPTMGELYAWWSGHS